MEFCEKVIYARAKLKLTQKQLAEQLGVANITINRWENKNSFPTKTAEICFYEFCKQHDITFETKNN